MKTAKKAFRLYEKIPDIDWIYMGGIIRGFVQDTQLYGIDNYIKYSIAKLSDMCEEFYFYPEEFHQTQKEIAEKAFNNPDWALDYNKRLKKVIKKYFDVANQTRKLNLKKLSDRELSQAWEKLVEAKEAGHIMGVVTTWVVDCDEQQFTKMLISLLNKKIKQNNLKLPTGEVLSTLTTPLETSSIQAEDIALIKLYDKYRQAKNKKAFFPTVERFADDHGWIFYKYIGPAKSADSYMKTLSNMAEDGVDAKLELKKIKDHREKTAAKQKEFIKLLKLDEKEQKLFAFARDIIIAKDYRKASQFYGCWVNEKILTEIARRLNLTLKQVRHFLPWEISPALLNKKYNLDELKRRHGCSVLFVTRDKYVIYSGKEAEKFWQKQVFEKPEIEVNQIKGMPACPGKVQGIVKRVDSVREIDKVVQGDIMFSHATYPELVPAMKRAAAIVTDEGGLGSHAAIVSRELHIPCVVGTKIGTQVFQDSDLVEVDATKGVIKKL